MGSGEFSDQSGVKHLVKLNMQTIIVKWGSAYSNNCPDLADGSTCAFDSEADFQFHDPTQQ